MYISIGSIIVDDIVLPDGETRMGMFGGGSTHAIAGMKVWADEIGIAAWVGHNLPTEMEAELRRNFDLAGVVRRDLPTPRAWQLFETDGRRIEIFRTDMQEFIRNSPRPEELPEHYWSATGVHYQNDIHNLPEWVAKFRAHGSGPVLWEPWGEVTIPENRGLFRSLMPLVDAISPNLLEGQNLTGLQDAEAIAAALLEDGARMVVLRMGSEGSLSMDREGQVVRVPPTPPARIVDVTGAGNAFCGGFVVGLAETGSMLQAACMGSVSASFTLEQFGAMYPFENIRPRAQERLDALLPLASCGRR